uniref:DUF4806 domain-containing protein n=1 Tax=Macrostomum lignano TaxID=282301 RepID=A0A1I8IR50_9PLAT
VHQPANNAHHSGLLEHSRPGFGPLQQEANQVDAKKARQSAGHIHNAKHGAAAGMSSRKKAQPSRVTLTIILRVAVTLIPRRINASAVRPDIRAEGTVTSQGTRLNTHDLANGGARNSRDQGTSRIAAMAAAGAFADELVLHDSQTAWTIQIYRRGYSGGSTCESTCGSVRWPIQIVDKKVRDHLCVQPQELLQMSTPAKSSPAAQAPVGLLQSSQLQADPPLHLQYLDLEMSKSDDGGAQADGRNGDPVSSSDSTSDGDSSSSGSQSDDGQSTDSDNDEDVPGFPGVNWHDALPVSLGEAICEVSSCARELNLTVSGTTRLLSLLHRLVPDNRLPQHGRTLRETLKKRGTISGSSTCYTVCNDCYLHSEQRCDPGNSNCAHCTSENVANFWLFDIPAQIRTFVESRGLLQSVTFPIERLALDEEKLHFANSELYKSFLENIEPETRSDLTYTICADGFPLFCTSNVEVCPVYLSINEVHERLKLRFVMKCGVWAGKKKVHAAAFLPIVVNALNTLRFDGVQYIDSLGVQRRLHLHPLMALFDAPARADALCMKRFSAIYGCEKCYIRTSLHPSGHGRVYGVGVTDAMLNQARRLGCVQTVVRSTSDTHTLAEQHAQQGGDIRTDVLGVRGLSPLSRLHGFDFVRGCPPCFLHQLCSGLVRNILYQLFLVRHEKPDRGATNCPDLHARLSHIDQRLRRIRVPRTVQRHTVRLLKDIRHMRGHEYAMWLLAFAPFVLDDFLPEEHYWHILILSTCIFWMSLEGAPRAELRHVEIGLRHFHANLSRLYSLRFLSYNAHQVCCHMLPYAILAGPLNRQSAGLFESMHTRLRRQIHGSRRTDVEIVGAVERELAVMQAEELLRDNDQQPRARHRTTCMRAASGILLRRPNNMAHGWRSASLPSGLYFEEYLPEIETRASSAFVAIAGCQPTSFQFGRVLAIECDNDEVYVNLHILPVQDAVVDPLEALCAVHANSENRGARFAHIRGLLVNPFGPLPHERTVRVHATAIVGSYMSRRTGQLSGTPDWSLILDGLIGEGVDELLGDSVDSEVESDDTHTTLGSPAAQVDSDVESDDTHTTLGSPVAHVQQLDSQAWDSSPQAVESEDAVAQEEIQELVLSPSELRRPTPVASSTQVDASTQVRKQYAADYNRLPDEPPPTFDSRRRYDRQRLPAQTCPDCEAWYANLPAEVRDQRLQRHGRHRHRPIIQAPNFFSIDMPPSPPPLPVELMRVGRRPCTRTAIMGRTCRDASEKERRKEAKKTHATIKKPSGVSKKIGVPFSVAKVSARATATDSGANVPTGAAAAAAAAAVADADLNPPGGLSVANPTAIDSTAHSEEVPIPRNRLAAEEDNEPEMVPFKAEAKARFFVFQYTDFHQRTEVVSTDSSLMSTSAIISRRSDVQLPLNTGAVVAVVTARSKRSTARRYLGTLIKGPFDKKREAAGAASLTNVHAAPAELPRSCSSCRGLVLELQREKALTESLRGELKLLRTSETNLLAQNRTLLHKTSVQAKMERKLVMQVEQAEARNNCLLRNVDTANALLARASNCLLPAASATTSGAAAAASHVRPDDTFGDAVSSAHSSADESADDDAFGDQATFSADRNLSVAETRALIRACDAEQGTATSSATGGLVALSDSQKFFSVPLRLRSELEDRHKEYKKAMEDQQAVDLDAVAMRRFTRLALLRAVFRAVFTSQELANSSLSGRRIAGYVSAPANPAKVAVARQWLQNAEVPIYRNELHRAFTRCGETARLQLGLPKRSRPKRSTAARTPGQSSRSKATTSAEHVLRIITEQTEESHNTGTQFLSAGELDGDSRPTDPVRHQTANGRIVKALASALDNSGSQDGCQQGAMILSQGRQERDKQGDAGPAVGGRHHDTLATLSDSSMLMDTAHTGVTVRAIKRAAWPANRHHIQPDHKKKMTRKSLKSGKSSRQKQSSEDIGNSEAGLVEQQAAQAQAEELAAPDAGQEAELESDAEPEPEAPTLTELIISKFAGDKGEFYHGTMHGKGKYTWTATGMVYEGDFYCNQITGVGKYTWDDGSSYDGQVVQGVRHGVGVYTHPSGLSYDGQWHMGMKQGQGKLSYSADGSSYYEGQWLADRPHGEGVRRYPSGNVYQGMWYAGLRHGQGTMRWADKDETYTGQWEDGVQHGVGQHTWYLKRAPNSQYMLRNIYEGDFFKGRRHGYGVFYYPSGSRYEGQWANDMKCGHGKFIFKNGRVFEGQFKDDRMVEFPSFTHDAAPLRITTRSPLPGEVHSVHSNASVNTLSPGFQLGLDHIFLAGELFDCDLEEETGQDLQLLRYFGHGELEDNANVLTMLQFWRLMKDCRFINDDWTLAKFNRLLVSNYDPLTPETAHNPYKEVVFLDFLNHLVTIAYHLYGTSMKCEKGLLASCFTKLIKERLLPNACSVRGPPVPGLAPGAARGRSLRQASLAGVPAAMPVRARPANPQPPGASRRQRQWRALTVDRPQRRPGPAGVLPPREWVLSVRQFLRMLH